MKKYKALSRVFLLSYLIIIFCGVLFGLLLVKPNVALGIVFISIMVLDWINLIVAKHLFTDHRKAFLIMSHIGIGLMTLSVIGSLVLESIYTSQGEPAPYAWMIVGISIVLTALVDFYYVRSLLKIRRLELIESGQLVEREEEV